MSRIKGSKRPDLSKYNRARVNPLKGKKCPWVSKMLKKRNKTNNPAWSVSFRKRHSEMMKKNNPMKRPELIEKMKNGQASHMNSLNQSPSKPQVVNIINGLSPIL